MVRTKQEYSNLITETAEFYSEDVSRRALSKKTGVCLYTTEDKKHCAVGRCLTEEAQKEIKDVFCGISELGDFVNPETPVFKKQYQGFDNDFWISLQSFHDYVENWNEDGLTEIGQKKLEKLHEDFGI